MSDQDQSAAETLQDQARGVFAYTAPSADQLERYDQLRKSFAAVFMVIAISCEDNRERALAITRLEEAAMWANKSVSREVSDGG